MPRRVNTCAQARKADLILRDWFPNGLRVSLRHAPRSPGIEVWVGGRVLAGNITLDERWQRVCRGRAQDTKATMERAIR